MNNNLNIILIIDHYFIFKIICAISILGSLQEIQMIIDHPFMSLLFQGSFWVIQGDSGWFNKETL